MRIANTSPIQVRVTAIESAEELSTVIVREYPQVAGDYRAGLSQKDIVDLYGIDQLTHTQKIARQAMVLALKVLIPDEQEREQLANNQNKENGVKMGLASLKDKKGVHALSSEEHRENAKKSNEAKGLTVWSDEEQAACIQMMSDPTYQYPMWGKVCIDLAKIASELNRLFHNGKNVRTQNSVRGFRDKHKKSP